MKEYLKMSDVFIGKYNANRRTEAHPSWRHGENYIELYGAPADYAAHAINSHDELVADVERLRGMVQDAFIDGCHAGWDVSGEGYNAEYGGPDDGAMHDMFVTKSIEYNKGA